MLEFSHYAAPLHLWLIKILYFIFRFTDASPSSQLSRESSPSTSPQHSNSSSSASTSSPYGVLSEDLFAETVIPHLCKIVLVRDHDIFLTLLRFLPQYLHLIPKDKLEETFLPQMLLGLQVCS